MLDLPAETARLLDFGSAARVDGGFAWLDDRGRPDRSEPMHLLVTARMTHVYAIGHLLGRPGSAELADHGLAALAGPFADREAGGWHALLRDGEPEGGKRAYEHAFVLLAGASAAIAERPGARELLDTAAEVLLERFWSEVDGAAADAWDAGWEHLEPYRGANANMHLVEAFMAAGDATGDGEWHERALRVASRLVDGSARSHRWRLPEHYDEAWRPLPDYNEDRPRDPFRPFGVTPGHGLEWARLLLHLQHALPRPPGWLPGAARALFSRALEDGWETNGGIVYTTDGKGRPVVRDRFHWVVAEAIGAAAALHRATGEAAYGRWHERLWAFADARLIDREHGSWHHELDARNRPAHRTWHGKPDVYHAFQATLVPRLPLTPSIAGAVREGAVTLA